jgi:hypothetical protein
LLSGPVTTLAIVAFWKELRSGSPLALLTGAALFVVFNEGTANWQAL